jgi:hypothetical protein
MQLQILTTIKLLTPTRSYRLFFLRLSVPSLLFQNTLLFHIEEPTMCFPCRLDGIDVVRELLRKKRSDKESMVTSFNKRGN